MKLTITIADNTLKIADDENECFNFSLDDPPVDLNVFIKFISESEDKIECSPDTWHVFKERAPEIPDEVLKLAEYVYKIVNAFNESYDEIYLDKEEDYDDNSEEPEFDDGIPF